MPRRETKHKYHPTLTPQYNSYVSELTPHDEPVIVDGSNVLINRRGWIERRPGTASYEGTATNGNVWQRVFTYRKYNGDTFVMANEVTATQSKVYKLKIGTDTTFQSLSTWGNQSLSARVPQFISREGAAPKWVLPSTGAGTNLDTLKFSDDIKATTTLSAAQSGTQIKAYGFYSAGGKFSLPSNVTIVGIQVDIELIAGTANEVEDLTIKLCNNANPTGFGNNKARAAGTYWPTSDTVVTYGGASDLWGLTPTAEDINDDIGVIIACKDKAGGAGSTAAIDQVTMTITVDSIANPFDFVVANDTCYYSNGVVARKYDGTSETQWGITPPLVRPTFTNAGTGITSTVGWKYVYCYVSSSGHISSPSPTSASTGVITDDTITVTCTASTASDIVSVRLYRSTDGGDGIFFEIADVPNPGSGTVTIDDAIPDTMLSTHPEHQAPPQSYNDPPEGMLGLKHWNNRIWGFKDNQLMFTGWEEIISGVEEESFPSDVATGNRWFAPQEITNLAVVGKKDDETSALLPITRGRVFKVTGDSRDAFAFQNLFTDLGSPVKQNKGIAEDGPRVFLFGSDRRIWATDGISKQMASEAITDELAAIAFDDFSMVVHRFGEHHWLVIADNADDTKGIIATSATSPGTAADTGENSANGDGTGSNIPWTNPGNVTVSDDTYATRSIQSGLPTNWLRCTNYSFSVPSTATIRGILFEIEANRNTTPNPSVGVHLCNSGAVLSNPAAKQTVSVTSSSDAYYSTGSSGRTWGQLLTPTIVNGSTFGAQLRASVASGTVTLSVDHARMTVYYTNGSSSARWFVMDLLTGKWMPPWTLNAMYLHSAELAAGQYTLLYCSRDGTSANSEVRKILIPPETEVYTDGSTSLAYASDYVLMPEKLSPEGFVTQMDTFSYYIDASKTTSLNAGESPVVFFNPDEESDAVTWNSSTVVVDDLGTFASTGAVAPSTAPTLYARGTNFKEYVAAIRKAFKMALIRFYWYGANQNFRHLTASYDYRLLGGED